MARIHRFLRLPPGFEKSSASHASSCGDHAQIRLFGCVALPCGAWALLIYRNSVLQVTEGRWLDGETWVEKHPAVTVYKVMTYSPLKLELQITTVFRNSPTYSVTETEACTSPTWGLPPGSLLEVLAAPLVCRNTSGNSTFGDCHPLKWTRLMSMAF